MTPLENGGRRLSSLETVRALNVRGGMLQVPFRIYAVLSARMLPMSSQVIISWFCGV